MPDPERTIYLVQHGEAESKDEHPARPLSEKGRQDVARVADWAAKQGVTAEEIRHSGKLRAHQTAEILSQKVQEVERVVVVQGIAPMDDVEPVAKTLAREEQSVMLVGHLPFMERLASLLVAGRSDRRAVRFHMGGIVGLTGSVEQWSVSLYMTPEMAP